MAVTLQLLCPHCLSKRTQGHGSFPCKNGPRRPRRLCRSCGRTFSPYTSTPTQYMKKRAEWEQLPALMTHPLSLRHVAAVLRIRPATAFRWRHLRLELLCSEEQPVLTGQVAASESFVPYSEKGSRTTSGPGSWGCLKSPPGERRLPDGTRYRRLIEERPSCVLFATARGRHAVSIIGRGRPRPADLKAALARVLGTGAELWGRGLAPYAEACQHLTVPYHDATSSLCKDALVWVADQLRWGFRGWWTQFRGVATRYLDHYLAWFANTRPAGGPRLA